MTRQITREQRLNEHAVVPRPGIKDLLSAKCLLYIHILKTFCQFLGITCFGRRPKSPCSSFLYEISGSGLETVSR